MTKCIINTEPCVKNTDYRNNTNEIETNYKDKNKTNYRDFEDVGLEITCNNTLLPPFCFAKYLVPKNTVSIIKFDIMQSSLPTNLAATIDQKFLSSAAN